MARNKWLLWGVCCFLFSFASAAENVVVNKTETIRSPYDMNAFITAHLRKSHPRLLLIDAKLDQLKRRAQNDADLKKIIEGVIFRADQVVQAAEIPDYRKPDGLRLLNVSRKVMNDMYTLGVAWRWTGDKKYSDFAVQILMAACAFKDWNPRHFLDTAEMCNGVAIGYDWFYPILTEEQCGVIRQAIVEKGLKAKRADFYCKKTNNWNVVCNGGLTIGALAVAEYEPALAAKTVARMLENVPVCLKQFAPDGVWGEGVGYWEYTARYMALLISALDTALETDFGLSKLPGIEKSPLFIINAVGPTKRFLTYADAGGKRWNAQFPVFFWFSEKFNIPFYAADEIEFVRKSTAQALHLVWYPDHHEGNMDRKKDVVFAGQVPIMFSRSSWSDDKAIWVGVKGGDNQITHGHLDLGNFELDALGKRWMIDLGGDNYNLPGYWNRGRGGARWQYFRLNSHGHNVPLIDDKGQDPGSMAPMERFVTKDDGAFCVIDLSAAYAFCGAESVKRGVQMLPGRREVLVQDEFILDHDGKITSGFVTEAELVKNKNGIEMKIGGSKCQLDILAPESYTVHIKDAPHQNKEENKPAHRINKGVKRIEITADAKAGVPVAIAVVFRPLWNERVKDSEIAIKPLNNWK